VIRIGSMCSGYGGLEMAVAAALTPQQVEVAWHCEVDPAAVETLDKHRPGTPNHGDLRTVDWSVVDPVDLLAMGVPCQTVSAAGRQQAENDPRWLWPAAYAGLRTLRPPMVVFENVRNLVSIRKGEVWADILADLRAAGYAVRWVTVGACTVGAPHHRHRVFALAAYVGPAAPAAVRLDVPECGNPRGANGRDMLLTPRAGDGDGKTGASARRSDGYGPAGLASQLALLATPLARDGEGRNEGDAAYWERKRAAGFTGGIPLGAQVTLMATPTTADASGGRSVDGRIDRSMAKKALQIQVLTLLPTPRGSDGKNGGPNQGIASGDIALSSAVIGERFGPYAAAVARWEAITGVPAPEPTETGPRGGRRLAAAFPEWMMGLPAGRVTGHLDRKDALRLVGNGVCPRQGARAIDVLLTP
jgi:DNA (cytosine-5)-methyltransferase 1